MIEKETHRILDNGIHLIHVNCSHPDFPEKYKNTKLLAEDIMEANLDKIHNEEIRNTYYEIGKNVERSDNMSAMTINKLFDEVQKMKIELKRKDEEHQKEIENKDEEYQKEIGNKDKEIENKNKEIENKNERIKLLENALLKNNIELPSV